MGHSSHSRFSRLKRKRRRLYDDERHLPKVPKRDQVNQTPYSGKTVLRKSRQRSHLTHLQNLSHGTPQDDPGE